MQDAGGDAGASAGADAATSTADSTPAVDTPIEIPTESAPAEVNAPSEPASSTPPASDLPPPVVVTTQSEPVAVKRDPRSLLTKALGALQVGKRKKLEKVLALAQQKRTITNDDVQKLLRVSDATATRYLSQLVKEGRLKRVGSAENARYEPN
jgi:hypothetical protein